MDENGICDQHGRSLDHPWGCFGCALAEILAKNDSTHEPEWLPLERRAVEHLVSPAEGQG